MLRTIIEKEIRDIIGSSKFAISFGVCAALILLCFVTGAVNYKTSQAQYEAAKAENLRQMEGLTDWFSVQQHRIFLPPHPLASLVSGVSNDIGRTTEVRGRGELNADGSRYAEDPVYAVFRFLDLEFLFQVVLSLLAILLGYDAISGEKERGTLRLSFSNGLPRATYILGKLIGSFLALIVPLLLALAIGSLIYPILGVPLSGIDWLRLALIILAGLLFVGAFLTLSVMVSAFTQRTSSSFLVLLVVWIGAVLIIPRASVLLAGRMVDVPSVDELASQKARLASQLMEEDRTRMSEFNTPPAAPGEDFEPDKMLKLFNTFMDSLADARDKQMAEFGGRLNEDRANKQQAQERLAFSIARVSPSASFALATSALAGTDMFLKEHYRDQTMDYQQEYGKFMKEKTGLNPGGRMVIMLRDDNENEKPKEIDPSEMPAFKYAPPAFAESFGRAIFDLGLLAFFNLLFFTGSVFGFLRYDVR
ncbi:MAG: ABC transporter permease [candidate division Zixibacteria bacterium]|nr:ABC transporter permease [candidate division Zixibacteria bacterium]